MDAFAVSVLGGVGEGPDGWTMLSIVLIAGAGFIIRSTGKRNTEP
jgi:hypothetical protein